MDGQQFPSYIYLNGAEEDTYLGFIDGPEFFFIIKSAGLGGEQGDSLIELLRHTFTRAASLSLTQFDSLITDILRQQNVPLITSLAAGKIQGNTVFLKTVGEGQVYIQRGGNFAKLLQGNNVASGPVLMSDIFLFSTASFPALFSSTNHLAQFMKTHSLETIVDALQNEFGERKDHGNVALFIQYSQEKQSFDTSTSVSPVLPKKSFSFSQWIQEIRTKGMNKRLTLILVMILGVILIWSVVFGYQRRVEQDRSKAVEITTQEVNTLLTSAQSIATTNLSDAKNKISEADALVLQLEEKVGEYRKEAVANLKTSIRDTENTILQRDRKIATEFYDLTLEDKEGKGQKMILAEDTLYILNAEKGSVYQLSIPQKSIDVIKNTHFSTSAVFDIYEETIYVMDKGVYKIDEQGQTKKIIENDAEWGSIKDIKIYGGNVYLLDVGNNDLYKYSVTESGFGDKISYLSGYTLNLSQANSVAIDGSIYIDTPEKVHKFTAGASEDFATDYLESPYTITKVIANAEMEEVYLWDKTHGVVYVTDKKGVYKKSITANTFKQATDLVVFENKIYSLQSNKLFVVETN